MKITKGIVNTIIIFAMAFSICSCSKTDTTASTSDEITVEQARDLIISDYLDLVLIGSNYTDTTLYVDRETKVIWVKYTTPRKMSFCPIPNADGTYKTFKGDLPETGNCLTDEEILNYAKEYCK